jgi:hypothetical protein
MHYKNDSILALFKFIMNNGIECCKRELKLGQVVKL